MNVNEREIEAESDNFRLLNGGSKRIFFSVGEPSGDLHAAKLIESMQQQTSTPFHFRGFGGSHMSQVGCNIDYQLTDLAVVGFAEVLPKLQEFFRVADIASDIFEHDRPDAVVLIDFPGFNWHIAKRAKKFGIPVFYYMPPQLWAWGSWRLKKMRRLVDHILCALPIESQWFEQRNVASDLVGHPFFDEVAERVLDANFVASIKSLGEVIVSVLPGSRNREIETIWPLQLEMIRRLSKGRPNVSFAVACLNERHLAFCRSKITPSDEQLNLSFHSGRTSEIIEASDCSLMKSGSVSLEIMARGKPAVVIYHSGRMLYTIGRRLTNIKYMSLPNLIADKPIMPEYLAIGKSKSILDRATASLAQLIDSPEARRTQQSHLRAIKEQIAQPGASVRAAQKVLEHLTRYDSTPLPVSPESPRGSKVA